MNLNLEIFTAQERGRYELNKVFVKGGRRWATDGVILVGEKAADVPDTDGDFPNPAFLFKGFPKDESIFKKIELPLVTIPDGRWEPDGESGLRAVDRFPPYLVVDGGKYDFRYITLLLLLPGLRVHHQADFDRSGARRLCCLWDRGAAILMGVDD